MMLALATGVLLGLSAGLTPGPMLALVLAQSLRHGSREGCKIALVPLVTDPPIILITLLFATRLPHLGPLLGIISIAGAFFILYLAWESFRLEPQASAAPTERPKSWFKGVVTNLLNPHPWLFWLTVGAATLARAMAESWRGAVAFLCGFYLFLVGSKVMVAVLAGGSRNVLAGRPYRVAMRVVAVVLVVFALLLFQEGWKVLAHSHGRRALALERARAVRELHEHRTSTGSVKLTAKKDNRPDGRVSLHSPSLGAGLTGAARFLHSYVQGCPRRHLKQSRTMQKSLHPLPQGTPMSGMHLGGLRYTLKRKLGRGQFSEVWVAWDRQQERDIALKLVFRSLLPEPGLLNQLQEQVRRISKLAHPAIVSTFDTFLDSDQMGLAMELVEGWSLAALKLDRTEHRWSLAEILPWVQQLGAALQYAHEQLGLVHGGLTPACLLLNKREQVRLSDFGLLDAVRGLLAASGSGLPGVVSYLSPQQTAGAKAVIADDIYGFGATIYELLTGTPPFFEGNIAQQVQQQTPPLMTGRLVQLGVEGAFPESWENTIAACLAKDPKIRPPRIKDVLSGLEEPLSEAGTEAGPGTQGDQVQEQGQTQS